MSSQSTQYDNNNSNNNDIESREEKIDQTNKQIQIKAKKWKLGQPDQSEALKRERRERKTEKNDGAC